MLYYNKLTKNAEFEVKLIEKNESRDSADWNVKLTKDIDLGDKYIPAGSEFKYNSAYDDTEEEVINDIASNGIELACNLSDNDIEGFYAERW